MSKVELKKYPNKTEEDRFYCNYNLELKRCRVCGEVKSIKDFYKIKKDSGWGLEYRCKRCNAIHSKEYYQGQGHKIKKELNKRYYENNKKEINQKTMEREIKKRKTEEGRIKYNAHQLVTYHKRVNNITQQPCEICGKLPTHAHHPDYNKPLEVKWVCRTCHGKIHRRKEYAGKFN